MGRRRRRRKKSRASTRRILALRKLAKQRHKNNNASAGRHYFSIRSTREHTEHTADHSMPHVKSHTLGRLSHQTSTLLLRPALLFSHKHLPAQRQIFWTVPCHPHVALAADGKPLLYNPPLAHLETRYLPAAVRRVPDAICSVHQPCVNQWNGWAIMTFFNHRLSHDLPLRQATQYLSSLSHYAQMFVSCARHTLAVLASGIYFIPRFVLDYFGQHNGTNPCAFTFA